MDFNHYFSNDEIEKIINKWAEEFPDLVQLQIIGESFEKRPIWLVTLTNKVTGIDKDKPAVWLDANIHATEISGTTTLLKTAYDLLLGYGRDEQTTRLLDQIVYYIVPRINPDGAALALADKPRFIRSGVRPYPWLELEDGLHEEDIDGDGRILQMRIEDPNGDWKISKLDPRLMEKRSLNEHGGHYYRLLPEGRMHNYDGSTIKLAAQPEGLDFNRNFPFEWRGESEQAGAGPYPISESETRTIAEFIMKHPNINAAITFHTFSAAILRCYSTKSDEEMETNDLWVYKKIGQLGTEFTGYRCVSIFHDFKYHPKEITTGGFDDWIYDHLGVFAFTVEIWDLPTEAGIKDRKFIEWFRDHPHTEDLQIIQWVDQNCNHDSYIEWYSYDHPQLGNLELGGWNQLFTWRNPPLNFIGKEAEKNARFAIALGDLLPKLSIHNLEITTIGNRNYRLELVVENTGFLPTYTSEQGKKRKAARPVRVELELPSTIEIINGKSRLELGHLEGRSNKLDNDPVWSLSPTDNRARAEWVVYGKPGEKFSLHILSERAGSIHRECNLPDVE